MSKNFADFILDAADNKELIGGFYKIVSQPDFRAKELIDFLDGKGYEVTNKDIVKIDKVRDTAESEFDFKDKDY